MVNDTDIVELNVNSKKFKLAVKKKEALEAREPQVIHVAAPTAGAANTGNGAKGSCNASSGATGGSGIVIIRYETTLYTNTSSFLIN